MFETSCIPNHRTDTWSVNIPTAGTNASPKLVDLTNDGILDIVMGGGNNEGEYSEYGVIAINGQNGALLWKVSSTDQIFGTPVFADVNQDQTPDVFIGGRRGNFIGIDGRSGKVLWRYKMPAPTEKSISRYARFNFYTAQIIPDQNLDAIKDLLVTNGGNVRAAAYRTENRFPGVLMILDSQNGTVLSADTMPDGKETYCSPVIYDSTSSLEGRIIFGTGGETISGSLYRTSLEALRSGHLSDAKELIRAESHGFIAPPVLADINSDKLPDIIAQNHDGTIYAIDGASDSLLWSRAFEAAEVNSTLAPGYFNEDNIPDFFSHLSMGKWPDNTGTFQVMVDGRSGEILYQDTMGCTGYYSPVTFDFDRDGKDEVLLGINQFNCDRLGVTENQFQLFLYDFDNTDVRPIIPPIYAKNVSTTPWLGDMDGDHKLDLIYCVQANTTVILEFFGMLLIRKEMDFPCMEEPRWGSYLGAKSNGVF